MSGVPRQAGPELGHSSSVSPETTVFEEVKYDRNKETAIPIDSDKETHIDDTHSQAPEDDDEIVDTFRPFDDLPDERPWILTTRAVFIGLCAGTLVNASNVYLGLKSGWTFSANLFGAIAGFAIIRFFSQTFSENFPILGGTFGPRENNIIQTAATASGGLSNVFVSAFPAMYQLGLLDTPKNDFWRIVSLTAVGGFFGFFFATPLRKFFIIYVARELTLIFPTATATAMSIRSMHDAVRGQLVGVQKMKALSIAFVIALVLRVVSQYALGILWEWHPFLWFYIWGHYNNLAIHVENWGWYVQFTPAFIGSGMLVGLNVSISFFAGSVLAWGIIGPALVHNNMAFGKLKEPDEYKWRELMNFASFTGKALSRDTPSPRYWMLWPGVLAMVAISFTELLLQWRVILFAARAVVRSVCSSAYDAFARAGKDVRFLNMKEKSGEGKDVIEDPAADADLVRMWMWGPGLIAVIIGMCVVMRVQYGMPVGMSLLSVFLAFFFSFLAIQCTGVTDITPLTAASKASQIILGGATKNGGWEKKDAQRLNLLGGALANMGANQATDLTCDFRVGFLLRTPPNQQWYAQGIGTLVSVFIAPLVFRLFMEAYPCILDSSIEKCSFSYPSVAAWRAVAVAVTDPTLPIPKSSGIFSIIFAILGSIMVLIRHYIWVGKLEWMRKYHPNMMCIALAFVIPQTIYGTAMCIGSAWAHIWLKRNPKSFNIFGYAIAAGLIAGEGIGGVVNAVLQVAGAAGDKYGTHAGCPIEC